MIYHTLEYLLKKLDSVQDLFQSVHFEDFISHIDLQYSEPST
jgi:hypothetical protein